VGRSLTPKQEAFVEAYLRLQNGGAAYKQAYDKTGQMSDNVAYVGASNLLRIPKIQEALKARKKALQALNSVCTVEELAESWSDEIRFDISELMDENGAFKSPKDLSPKVRRLIQAVKFKERIIEMEGGKRKIVTRWLEYKVMDRQRAAIELGKRIGFYSGGITSPEAPPTINITYYRTDTIPEVQTTGKRG
jgi:phage terminase small subunit